MSYIIVQFKGARKGTIDTCVQPLWKVDPQTLNLKIKFFKMLQMITMKKRQSI